MRKIIFVLFFLLLAVLPVSAQKSTLSQWMNWLQQIYGIHFVYSSDLNVDRPYRGASLQDKPLKKSLNILFDDAGIVWTESGRNIILKANPVKKKKAVPACVLTGYVRMPDREPVINASLYDMDTRRGVLTNEHGYFYMPLKEGRHIVRVSYVACKDQLLHLDIHRDMTENITLQESGFAIKEVVVNGDARSPLLSTQTGKRTLTATDINTEFSLLSSPDVIKTLQQISGVASGVEGASGLYVHGGENDENLFLLDNSPLYNINHSLGLFSSFNSDIIKNVDFYKSGFPARYGGRVAQ